MELNAKVTLVCQTEGGISKNTGKPWASKYMVVEVEDDSRNMHMAVRTFNPEIIAKMETLEPGDDVKIGFWVEADHREWTSTTGQKFESRSNNIYLRSLEVTNLKPF